MEITENSELSASFLTEEEEDSVAIASFSEAALSATWEHLVKNNLDDKWSTPEWKSKLLSKEYPDDCITTTIKSSSSTTRRGKRQRAYPRKGVVKISGDDYASKKKVGVHQLAAWKSTGRMPKPGEQASHFKCDNEECVNPSHIVWESGPHNSTRYCCKLFKNKKGYKCPHTPVCPGCAPCPPEDGEEN